MWSNHIFETRLSVSETTNGILMNVIFLSLSAEIFFLHLSKKSDQNHPDVC